LSLREVVQSTRATLAALPPSATRHRDGLSGFISRLYWHCHFIQKLESEPEIEWRNHGLYEVKGVEDPVEICEVGEPGFAPLKPPPDSEKAKRAGGYRR
jgi:hypothetical protein